MKNIILRFGALSGVLLAAWLMINFAVMDKANHSLSGGMVLGFAIMFIALGIGMILGLMALRKQNGTLKIGNAILLCCGVALVGSIFYVAGWAVTYKFIFPGFKEWYEGCLATQQKSGEITSAQFKEYSGMMANYDNPLYFVAYTLMEILPFGIGISLIIAPIYWLLTRKK